MPKRITELTQEQRDQFPGHVEKWTKIGLSTEPADFETFEKAILEAYEIAELKQPKTVVRVSSPIVGSLAASILDAVLKNTDVFSALERHLRVDGFPVAGVDNSLNRIHGTLAQSEDDSRTSPEPDIYAEAIEVAVETLLRMSGDRKVEGERTSAGHLQQYLNAKFQKAGEIDNRTSSCLDFSVALQFFDSIDDEVEIKAEIDMTEAEEKGRERTSGNVMHERLSTMLWQIGEVDDCSNSSFDLSAALLFLEFIDINVEGKTTIDMTEAEVKERLNAGAINHKLDQALMAYSAAYSAVDINLKMAVSDQTATTANTVGRVVDGQCTDIAVLPDTHTMLMRVLWSEVGRQTPNLDEMKRDYLGMSLEITPVLRKAMETVAKSESGLKEAAEKAEVNVNRKLSYTLKDVVDNRTKRGIAPFANVHGVAKAVQVRPTRHVDGLTNDGVHNSLDPYNAHDTLQSVLQGDDDETIRALGDDVRDKFYIEVTDVVDGRLAIARSRAFDSLPTPDAEAGKPGRKNGRDMRAILNATFEPKLSEVSEHQVSSDLNTALNPILRVFHICELQKPQMSEAKVSLRDRAAALDAEHEAERISGEDVFRALELLFEDANCGPVNVQDGAVNTTREHFFVTFTPTDVTLKDNVRNSVKDAATNAAVIAAADKSEKKMGYEVFNALLDCAEPKLDGNVPFTDATRFAVGLTFRPTDSVIQNSMPRLAVAAASALAALVVTAERQQQDARKAARELIRKTLEKERLSWFPRFGGQFWVGGWYGSPAMVDFFTNVCGLELEPKVARAAKLYADICSSVNWFWCHEDFVLVCDRPKSIHLDSEQLSYDKGKAIEYRDGWGLYALDGVVLEKDLYEQIIGKEMTLQQIMDIGNADQRAVALKYNPEAIIASGAKLIDKSDRGNELFLIEGTELNELLRHKRMFYLRMQCPTGRVFVEGVDPEIAERYMDADACQAAAWDLSPDEYKLMTLEA